MIGTLHQRDEEVDVGAYQVYLRTQSDMDLMDIVRHLDPELYPARLDAAWRESRRRHVLSAPVYSSKEYAIRGIAVAAILLSIVTVALAIAMTPAEAAANVWPATIPDGTSTSILIRVMCIAVLHGIVFWSVRCGLYPLGICALGYWLVTRGPSIQHHKARKDVWQFVLLAQVILLSTIAVSAFSAVPLLFYSADQDISSWQRAFSLLQPWF